MKKAQRMATIGETTTMVGHDLRNPLQVVTSIVSMIDKKIGSNKEFTPLVERINSNLMYMSNIVEDLNTYSKPRDPVFKEFELRPIIDSAISSMEISEDIEVEVLIDDDFTLYADQEMFDRIIKNLIKNGEQAISGVGKLTLDAYSKDGFDFVSVKDTGHGISDENSDIIFTPLFYYKGKGYGFWFIDR